MAAPHSLPQPATHFFLLYFPSPIRGPQDLNLAGAHIGQHDRPGHAGDARRKSIGLNFTGDADKRQIAGRRATMPATDRCRGPARDSGSPGRPGRKTPTKLWVSRRLTKPSCRPSETNSTPPRCPDAEQGAAERLARIPDRRSRPHCLPTHASRRPSGLKTGFEGAGEVPPAIRLGGVLPAAARIHSARSWGSGRSSGLLTSPRALGTVRARTPASGHRATRSSWIAAGHHPRIDSAPSFRCHA